MRKHQSPTHTRLARKLRSTQTEAELLVWNVLRSRRLNGLKFRRQFPVPPFIADFACLEKMLVVEIDGECHNDTWEADKSRQEYLERRGWTVLRFINEDVLSDVEAVAIAIVRHLGLEPEFRGLKPS